MIVWIATGPQAVAVPIAIKQHAGEIQQLAAGTVARGQTIEAGLRKPRDREEYREQHADRDRKRTQHSRLDLFFLLMQGY